METGYRRRLTLHEKLALVTECRTSGLTAARWLQEHGIHENTYYGWIKQLKRAACEIPEACGGQMPAAAERNEIVRVDLEMPAFQPAAERQDHPSLEIVLRDATVRVYREATADLVAMAVQAARRSEC